MRYTNKTKDMSSKEIDWIIVITLMGLFSFALHSCGDDENPPLVSTTEVTDIQSTTAKSGGNITDDGGAALMSRGVIWSTSANLTINDNEGRIAFDGASTCNMVSITDPVEVDAGSFIRNITGLVPETKYYVRAFATNRHGTGYGNTLAFTTLEENTGTGVVTDIDDNVYGTVIIGDQEWMTENLRVTRYNNGGNVTTGLNDEDWANTTEGAYTIFDHKYEDADGIDSPEAMVEAYGKLYNWYAVVDDRGLCPEGWSVPSIDDWNQLVNTIASQGYTNEWNNPNSTANALKSCRQVGSPLGGDCDTSEHPRWNMLPDWADEGYGFNEFGFSALPGGLYTSGSFYGLGRNGSWCSLTEQTSFYACVWQITSTSGNVQLFELYKSSGLSVRCVRNIE